MELGGPDLRESAGDHASEVISDRLAIRELLENWIIWRDAGNWDRFKSVWHDDGRMVATWVTASAADFIAGCRRSFDRGLVGLHSLGGGNIELNGSRAVAQTRMQITQRAAVHGVDVDVICQGRFIDALEKRGGVWGIVLRQPVYELDRIAPLEPGAPLKLDPQLLQSFPEGYRHLAYVQTGMGFTVNKNLPGTRGPEIDALMNRIQSWLAGGSASCLD